MNADRGALCAIVAIAALGTVSSTAADPQVPARQASLVPEQSGDGQDRRVRIHNQTGWTMTHFYASQSRLADWQEDMLGQRALASGASLMMNIDDGSGACVYNFKARFTNDQELTRFDVNVCRIADYYYTR